MYKQRQKHTNGKVMNKKKASGVNTSVLNICGLNKKAIAYALKRQPKMEKKSVKLEIELAQPDCQCMRHEPMILSIQFSISSCPICLILFGFMYMLSICPRLTRQISFTHTTFVCDAFSQCACKYRLQPGCFHELKKNKRLVWAFEWIYVNPRFIV